MSSQPEGVEPVSDQPVGNASVSSEPVGVTPVSNDPGRAEPVSSQPVGNEPVSPAQEIDPLALSRPSVSNQGASRVSIWERLIGGAVGTRAIRRGVWFWPGFWVYLSGTLSFIVLMWRQLPCVANPGLQYKSMCYTDITPLFHVRGLKTGGVPFFTAELEYPVLTGGFMHLSRLIVNLFGGKTAPNVTGSETQHAALLFFAVTAVLLFALFLVVLWAHLRLARPWDALQIALAPAVWTCGLVNWDFLVLAATALALLAWARKSPGWTGFWIGVGVAAKLYPLLLLVPLAVLCLRTGKVRAWLVTVVAAVASWTLLNLPVYWMSPSGWLKFWTLNTDRGADWGSIWLFLSRVGVDVPKLSLVVAVLMVIGTLAICLLGLLARQRPRLAQLMLLLMVLFLVVNKVYSPQYVLWLLPFMVLARPSWRLWAVFGVTEYVYYWAIWTELGKFWPPGTADLYPWSILVRVVGQLLIAGFVVRDILRPEHDLVRTAGADDPDGGIFDECPDAVAPKPRRVAA